MFQGEKNRRSKIKRNKILFIAFHVFNVYRVDMFLSFDGKMFYML